MRTSIIELYDEIYYINEHARELQSELYIGSIGMINKRLFTTSDIGHKIPINFNELKKDTEFINTIAQITAEKINFQNYSSLVMSKTIVVKEEIDNEIKKLIDECYKKAYDLINSHRTEMETITHMLVEKEILTVEEICDAIHIKRPVRLEESQNPEEKK